MSKRIKFPRPAPKPRQNFTKIIIGIALDIFSNNCYEIKRLETVIENYEIKGGRFIDLMGESVKTEKKTWQKRYLRNVLSEHKENGERVFRKDWNTKTWIYIPGLLYIGTREDNPILSRQQTNARLDGIKAYLQRNRDGNNVEIQKIERIQYDVDHGKVFPCPTQASMFDTPLEKAQ